MATLVPFRGLVYSPSRIPDFSAVVAPPYDVISEEKACQYRARHPNNIVHIDLPEGASPQKYEDAARTLARWRASGVLARDETPSIYVTSQRYSVRGMPERTRWGFIALLRIEEDSAGVVLPHERTMDKPRSDRRDLILATRAQISPIFVLYSDPPGEISTLIEPVVHRPADRWVSDESGVDTRLWRIGDQDTIRAIQECLSARKIWIADGHHRYAAAREARNQLAAGERPGHTATVGYDHVLAYFSNVDAPGLTILPYHRVLRGIARNDVAALSHKIEAWFDVKNFSFEGFDHRAEQIRRRLREVADRGRIAVALYSGGAEFVLLVFRQGARSDALLTDLPEPLRDLDVSVLHRAVFESALGMTPDVQRSGLALRYTEEIERAMSWVDAADDQVAFLLNTPRRTQMLSVAEKGLQMPQKSTYFYPKVLTGLVLHPFDTIDNGAATPDVAPNGAAIRD